ncbi:non-ribosomal peptide synthase domain TIGR01720/amino acid adenylation domain-containing protein [Methylomagnum ishizawai]|uniref:Non-ribosomal peptide synthase domain TIGR01720/amino acid adenylation domain-containing protein n=1 Tax=Methylomagnum ishizawai TaxID=1760988 RepID=A0A1Y6D3E5_9GAMM|nr:non-ribosomal peptide synthetase [Methylomagnum ishizawai]SMF97469.1 non-ribosomal peptide synthase domain TIGR01720/amino acid adenylation domain-containing protein [Methylomagnum ishizawai]
MNPPSHANHFVELLRWRAESHPERTALYCLDGDGAALQHRYADLDLRARAVAARLQAIAAPGERAVILLPSGAGYVEAFLGCLYAGVIAVPAYPPESLRPQPVRRLAAILADARPRVVLTATALLDTLRPALADAAAGAAPEFIAVDAIADELAEAWRDFAPRPETIAFLQYTSGSTATPKGVMVAHANLMANEQAIQRRFAIGGTDTFVSWLPLYHDMGLVGGLLQPLYSGIAVALMTPRQFLERPVRWLEAVSRFGGTVSGGPNFAFQLCVERVSAAQTAGLNLESWRLAFCGAEPVRRATLDAFAAQFGACGLKPQALYPCYGLAESTLLVTGGQAGGGVASRGFDPAALAGHRAAPLADGVELVDCGWVQDGHELRLFDPASGEPVAQGSIGEIWLSGPSVAQGYWCNPEATAATFPVHAGKSWLRTGDLGCLDADGHVFVTGRLKDVILIRGQNLYPQDIEQAVEEQVELIRKGRVAAFAVDIEGREAIGIAAEVSRNIQKLVPPATLFQAIGTAVAETFQEPACVILLLQPGALPKTSSGKLQRAACRSGWRDGSLDSYAVGGLRPGSEGWRELKPAAPGLPLQAQASGLLPKIAAAWREILGLAEIGPTQSFFVLGGNSIDAARLLARLREEWGIDLEPGLLFEASTLGEFAARVEERFTQAGAGRIAPIPRLSDDDRLPLSPGQEALWFLARQDADSTAYHIGGGLRLSGPLDPDALRRAFDHLALRHASLRTCFNAGEERPCQRIDPAGRVAWSLAPDSAAACAAIGRPFDLERGPLCRAVLVRVAENIHELWLGLHHLIADGRSVERLLAELAECYAAARAGRAPRLPELPIRHADFAAWQWSRLDAGAWDGQLAYWTGRLDGEPPMLELPTDRPRPAMPSPRGGRVVFQIERDLGGRLTRLAQAAGATRFIALLAGFQALLYRYTGQRDLWIGVPHAQRDRAETQNLVGYWVNLLVLRVEVDGGIDFHGLLARTKAAALGAQNHADLPFGRLVDALRPERGPQRNPLCPVAYNHQRLDFSPLENGTGWRVERLDWDSGAAQFDLALDTEEDAAGNLGGVFTYAADLFERATVERLCGHFLGLLRQWAEQPARPLSAVPLLSAAEQTQFAAWNAWEKRWAPVPVHELFRRQAEARPTALAVVDRARRLGYGELEARANRLAHRLIRLGAGPERIVGLLLPRSAEMLVAMLGTLKSGAAFLPLDPDAPAERRSQLIREAGVGVLVIGEGPEGEAGFGDKPSLRLDAEDSDAPDTAPRISIHPEQLAYLIHTSGSTGQPKGVAVSHGAFARHIQAAGALYGYGGEDVALHFAAFGFDAAMEQWAAPLTHGAGLVLGQPGWTGADTAAAIARHGVTVIYPPTPHLLHLADSLEAQGRRLSLRICTVGGEAVPQDSVDRIRRVLRPERLINGYGPTETVVTPLAWVAGPGTPCTTAYAPIGQIFGERTAYVLDADLNPVPVGVAGELYIGGPCLARGYLHRPGASAERFIPDPFGAAGGRLYRTGDRVRRLPDGTVEFLGRVDQQIKLRGYRIEPGEIEAALAALPGIRETVVMLREERGQRYLAAYVAADAAVEPDRLKTALAGRLPEYLVPARIVRLDALPRTRHGKVDRAALPLPEYAGETGYIAPRTATERRLAAIWQDLLGLERVGIADNFFELGGDSILSMQVAGRARQAGLRFAPKDLLRCQTIAALARVADATAAAPPSESAPATGEVPLTPIQAEFFALAIPNRHHWNQAVLLEIRRPLNLEHLREAIDSLPARHDSLRLRYAGLEEADGPYRPVQFYAEPEATELLWVRAAADAQDIERIAQEAQTRLDLERGPLLRAVYFRLADGAERLLLVAHHLVVDAVSWRILLESLQTEYARLETGHPPLSFPNPAPTFQAWAQRLAAYAHSAELRAEIGYWENELRDIPPSFVPDHPTGPGLARHRASLGLRLDPATTDALLHGANHAYRTHAHELLIAALARALCHQAGPTETLLELEGHGRVDLFPELDPGQTVGWFTSVYPVRLDGGADLGGSIRSVKEHLRQVPHQGVGYGLLRQLAPDDLRARIAALPRPAVTFNYLGRFDTSFDPHTALFRPAPEGIGLERDPDAPLANELEINAQVYAGSLRLEWRYSRERYREATIRALMDGFRDALRAVLEHCASGVHGVTPADFPLSGLTQDQLDALPQPGRIEDIYPLSPIQQGILFHTLQLGRDDPYFYQRAFLLEGELEPDAFAAAWRAVVARHPALRSAYRWDDSPVSIVSKQRELALAAQDWRGLPEPEQWHRLAGLIEAERARGFDFAGERGFGLHLLRVADQRHWLLWSHHHIAMDGWSLGLVLRDFMRAYRHGPVFERPAPDCADYVLWLRNRPAALDDWRGQLADWDQATPLPLPAAPGSEATGYEEHASRLDAEATARLRTAAHGLGVTPGTLLQAAHALLLGRHADSGEVVFGLTVSGRSAEVSAMEERVGLFINTLPLRVRFDPARSVGDWLRDLQAQVAELHRHEATPLADIQKASAIGEGAALFESILVFENYPLDAALQRQDGSLRIDLLDRHAPAGCLDHGRGRNNYPLSLIAHWGETLDLTYSGQRQRFQPGAMAVLAGRLRCLLEQLTAVPERRLGNIRLAPPGETALLRSEAWTPTPPDVLAAWRYHAALDPAALAVRDGRRGLSRAELDAASNRLARALLARGVRPETCVGVYLERSVELAVALLGILKAGGVYLPLDTGLPEARLQTLLAAAGATIVLGRAQPAWLNEFGLECLDPEAPGLAELSPAPLATPIQPGQAAYLIYTSGSTGTPKGVLVSHAALNHYVQGVLHRLQPWPEGPLAMVSTPAADLGHTVLFGALCAGRTLYCVPPDCVADPDRFAEAMAGERVAALKIVPGLLRGLLQAARPADALPERLLILGGEACPAELVETVRRLKPGCRIVNHYGPTETTVGALTYEPGSGALVAATLPIGHPLPGVQVHILDRDLNPLPEGVPGELYIGGPGVARGYLGSPAATAERFVPHAAGERLYRTGDRARLRNGAVEFLGRADAQVKIRGYRVEPEEAARALRALDGVRDAVVVADLPESDPGRARLLGYVVAAAGGGIEGPHLLAALARSLPDYLVPSLLIPLAEIPRTANGKLDRKRLPSPEAPHHAHRPPRTETERRLAALWQTVLKVERVGVTDNFFDLGGDSILSLQVIARARKQGLKLTPRQVFDHPVLADLAASLEDLGPETGAVRPEASKTEADSLPSLPPQESSLSYSQERLWFLAQLEPDSTAYHIAGGLRLSGPLDGTALRRSFEALAGRHEMLRTTFHAEDGRPFLRVHPAWPVAWRDFDLCAGTDSRPQVAGFLAPAFDLESAPPWRVALVRTGADSHELWLVLHHLIADGWSLNKLLEELAASYAAALADGMAHLPPPALRYTEYAQEQRTWLAGSEGERQLAYWTGRLGDEHPVLELPGSHPRSATTGRRGAKHGFQLPPELAGNLKSLARREGATPFMALLAAFQAVLYRHTGQRTFRVGAPVAQRDRLETETVVGCFVNTLVLCAEVDGRDGFPDLLAKVKATVLEAQEHSGLPFERLVEALKPERGLHQAPLFQVMYNHQKRDFSALDRLPGLRAERIELEAFAAQFGLSLATEEDAAGTISGVFAYAAEVFEPGTIARLADHFLRLLAEWTTHPERPLGGLCLLGAAERAQLAGWNATARHYPDPAPIHQRIRRQAEARPEAPALLWGSEVVAYGELERRANRLAHRLIRLGAGPDTLVGVALERRPELVVALLAVLKAGAAYVPLDLDYPAERLAYMLADSGVGIVLAGGGASVASFVGSGQGDAPAPRVLDLDAPDLSAEPDTAPDAPVHPEQLAYVIYTSGSTGRPKGAGNTHAALRNRLDWMQAAYHLGPDDTVLHKTPCGFDVSVWEFFWPLLAGARLAIAPPGAHRDPARLAGLIREHRVTTLHFVPSMLAEFAAHADDRPYPSLKRIVCSGEALPAELRDRAFQRFPGVDLHNLYGPTEAAIDVTHWTCRPADGPSVPIGHPIANLALHILDPDLNPVPPGVAGELYIGGAGLARGYHGRPGLTAERFVPDPAGPGTRLYRTGDRARHRADGAIEYLGRLDHQVKLRGVRIEPGEIEARLLAQPGVSEAVVLLADAPGGPRLVAYAAAAGTDADTLAAALRRQLPEAMLPSRILVLDRLPKTPNGKLDRKALPGPEWAGREYLPPATDTERRLAAIWQELLGVGRVGRSDRFFDLGGHSLLAVRMLSRVRAEWGVALPLASVFETPDLAGFGQCLDSARPSVLGTDSLAAMNDLLEELETLP